MNLEKIESNKLNIEGIFISQDYMRTYQFANTVSHLIGYTNKPNREEVELPFIANMPNLEIGKDGIEKSFNPNLIGKSGQREIEVNSYGRVIREISRQDSQKGNDIQITIDLRIQQYALNLLKEHLLSPATKQIKKDPPVFKFWGDHSGVGKSLHPIFG